MTVLLITVIALGLALYVVNEHRMRQKLKVDTAVIMLATLFRDKKNDGWLRPYRTLVRMNTSPEGAFNNSHARKELKAQVSVLMQVLKILDDK